MNLKNIVESINKINEVKKFLSVTEEFISDVTGKEFKLIDVIARDKNGNKKILGYIEEEPIYEEKKIRVIPSYLYSREEDISIEGEKIKYPTVNRTKDIVIRRKILTYFITEKNLFNEGYVEYKVEDLCNICGLPMNNEYNRINSMKNIRREIDNCVKLGLFNKHKAVVQIKMLPQHVGETDGAHYKRCRTQKGGIKQEVTWRISLNDEFYNKSIRVGYDWDINRFSINELNKIDSLCNKWAKENSKKIKWQEYLKKIENDIEVEEDIQVVVEEESVEEEVQVVVEEESVEEEAQAVVEEESVEEVVKIAIPEKKYVLYTGTKNRSRLGSGITYYINDSVSVLDKKKFVKRGIRLYLTFECDPRFKNESLYFEEVYGKCRELMENDNNLKLTLDDIKEITKQVVVYQKSIIASDCIEVKNMSLLSDWLENKYARYAEENNIKLRRYCDICNGIATEDNYTFIGIFKFLLSQNQVLNYNTVRNLFETELVEFISDTNEETEESVEEEAK